MATMQDYEDFARQVEYVFSLHFELHSRADTLEIPIPQDLAIALSKAAKTYPAEVREVGARRLGIWVDPPTERHDEEDEKP